MCRDLSATVLTLPHINRALVGAVVSLKEHLCQWPQCDAVPLRDAAWPKSFPIGSQGTVEIAARWNERQLDCGARESRGVERFVCVFIINRGRMSVAYSSDGSIQARAWQPHGRSAGHCGRPAPRPSTCLGRRGASIRGGRMPADSAPPGA
eukprot:834394-Prymnesium_polylepis.1